MSTKKTVSLIRKSDGEKMSMTVERWYNLAETEKLKYTINKIQAPTEPAPAEKKKHAPQLAEPAIKATSEKDIEKRISAAVETAVGETRIDIKSGLFGVASVLGIEEEKFKDSTIPEVVEFLENGVIELKKDAEKTEQAIENAADSVKDIVRENLQSISVSLGAKKEDIENSTIDELFQAIGEGVKTLKAKKNAPKKDEEPTA